MNFKRKCFYFKDTEYVRFNYTNPNELYWWSGETLLMPDISNDIEKKYKHYLKKLKLERLLK